MRTLLFTLEFPPFKGGVANVYGHMEKYWPQSAASVDGLSKDEHEAHLMVLHNNDGALLKNWLWPKWLPAMHHLKRAVTSQGVEHIIVGHILPLGTVVYRLHKKSGIPYTVFLHGMDLALAMAPGRKQMITKMILGSAANIICGNAYTAEMLKGFMGEGISERVHVVHPGIDPLPEPDEAFCEEIRRQHNLGSKTVLFSVGRLVKRKGFENVIKAMEKVTAVLPDLHYYFAGEGPEKMRLMELAMQTRNVTFLEGFDNAKKEAWMRLCDAFIMPSYSEGADFEGFGIVYLEAAICGKPAIGGRSGGVPEAIDDGVTGILVDPHNIDDIANAIIRLGQDPSLRLKLGQQGQARAKEWFNWERQVGKIYSIVCRK